MKKIMSLLAGSTLLMAGLTSAQTFNFDDLPTNTSIEKADSGFELINLDGTDIVAVVNSEQSLSGSNALKLEDNSSSTKPFVRRAFANGASDTGKVSAQIYIPKDNSKSTYIALGKGVTADGVERFLEVKVSGSGTVSFENGKNDPKLGRVKRESWNEFVVEWGEGSFSLTINGELIDDGMPILNPDNVPTGVVLYAGDNKSTGNYAYIDDLTSDLF